MKNSTPKSIEQKVFVIFGVPVCCHLLDDGRKVIAAESLTKLLTVIAAEIPDLNLEDHDIDHFIFWCRKNRL